MIYTIRIDDNDTHTPSTLERLTKFLEWEHYNAYLVYREYGDDTGKLHYQGFVEFDSSHLSAHKERFSRLFKDYPKGKKSSAIMKKEQYKVYITKDKDRILSKGYTEGWIQELETQSYKKDETVKKDYYDRFYEYLQRQSGYEVGRFSTKWVSDQLFDFFGVEKQEVKNFQFYKSLIWNCTSRCVKDSDDARKKKLKETFYNAVLN